MAPLPYDQDITSWPQLLSAIEDAEAGQGTARLTEICLSVYSALAAAQFQITQLKARVHVLATSRPGPHGDPMTVAGSRLPRPARTESSQEEHTMGLPAGEQRVLDTIENELRIADQQLAAAFAAFTRSASGTRMPRPERLTRLAPADHPPALLSSECRQVRLAAADRQLMVSELSRRRRAVIRIRLRRRKGGDRTDASGQPPARQKPSCRKRGTAHPSCRPPGRDTKHPMSYDRSHQMTRLPATTAAEFKHAVPIHGKTGIHWADPSGLGPVTGRSA